MQLEDLIKDKSIKSKAKVAQIGAWLLNGDLQVDELMYFAETQKSTYKATCIEAMEYATKKDPSIANDNMLHFATKSLQEAVPRIKWESAKVIGNIARQFPAKLSEPVQFLLANTNHEGTVVRWATAYALAEILMLKTEENNYLLNKIKTIVDKEDDNGVKKKYLDAIKKVEKSK